MAISVAIQRGSWVYIYDENGNITGTLCQGDAIVGYTSSTVSIKRGSSISIYDLTGSLLVL